MYLHDLLSSRLRNVLASWVSVHKLMPAAPAWSGAVSSNGVFSETLMSNHKSYQVNVLPIVPHKSIKRILIDAALGNNLALIRLSEMFELGLGVPVLPSASRWCRAYDPREDEGRAELAALIKSVRYSVRQQRMSYAHELGGLLPASYMSWLLHVRSYFVQEGRQRVTCGADLEPVLLVYVNKSDGEFSLCDAFALFGEDKMAASIGHHIVRFPNVVQRFTDSRLRKRLYVGVLAVASLGDFELADTDFPVSAKYVLTGCHRDDPECIALDLFYKKLQAASEHRRNGVMPSLRLSFDQRLRRTDLPVERHGIVYRAIEKGKIRKDKEYVDVSVNSLRETLLESVASASFERLRPSLQAMIDWYALDREYDSVLVQCEASAKSLFNSLSLYVLGMAQVSADGVSPFKMDNDFVVAALKSYGFTPASSAYRVGRDNQSNYTITPKAADTHVKTKVKKRR